MVNAFFIQIVGYYCVPFFLVALVLVVEIYFYEEIFKLILKGDIDDYNSNSFCRLSDDCRGFYKGLTDLPSTL
jgi:hypothetical protein